MTRRRRWLRLGLEAVRLVELLGLALLAGVVFALLLASAVGR